MSGLPSDGTDPLDDGLNAPAGNSSHCNESRRVRNHGGFRRRCERKQFKQLSPKGIFAARILFPPPPHTGQWLRKAPISQGGLFCLAHCPGRSTWLRPNGVSVASSARPDSAGRWRVLRLRTARWKHPMAPMVCRNRSSRSRAGSPIAPSLPRPVYGLSGTKLLFKRGI